MKNEILLWVEDNCGKEHYFIREGAEHLNIDDIDQVESFVDSKGYIPMIMEELNAPILNNWKVKEVGLDLMTPEQKAIEKILSAGRPSADNYYGRAINFEGAEVMSSKILPIFEGKKVLILENDHGLDGCIGNAYQLLLHFNIDSQIIFGVGKQDMKLVAQQIAECDILMYQSQYVYESTHKLIEYVKSLKQKKTIVEVYISEAFFTYKPDNIAHDIYAFSPFDDDDATEWEMYEVKEETGYWENAIYIPEWKS